MGEFVGILVSLASGLGLGVLFLTWFILTHYLIYNTYYSEMEEALILRVNSVENNEDGPVNEYIHKFEVSENK
jgi:hypothetical protein